jgi:hypothetical protein
MESALAKTVAVPAADQPKSGSFDAKGVKIRFLVEGKRELVGLDPFREGEAPSEPLRIPFRLERTSASSVEPSLALPS